MTSFESNCSYDAGRLYRSSAALWGTHLPCWSEALKTNPNGNMTLALKWSLFLQLFGKQFSLWTIYSLLNCSLIPFQSWKPERKTNLIGVCLWPGALIKPFPLALSWPCQVFWYSWIDSIYTHIFVGSYILLTGPLLQLPFEIHYTEHLWWNETDKVYTVTVSHSTPSKPDSRPAELVAGSTILCPASITLSFERHIAASIVIGCVSTLIPVTGWHLLQGHKHPWTRSRLE